MTMDSEKVLSIPKWQRFERRFKSSFFYSSHLQEVKVVGEFNSHNGGYLSAKFSGGKSRTQFTTPGLGDWILIFCDGVSNLGNFRKEEKGID